MYHDSKTNPYPYSYSYPAHVRTPMYHSNGTSRNPHENNQQEMASILSAIKGEATAIDLYRRLARVAPNQKHTNNIVHALENKKAHLNQLINLYISLTGRQPVYQIDKVRFDGYQEGLKKAYEAGVKASEEYQEYGLYTQHPVVQNVLLQASTGEKETAVRFEALNEVEIKDDGSHPLVVDIEKVTKHNKTFRTALWTGSHLQLTLMSIAVGEDIGLEVHPDVDQFIRIEEGQGLVQMGDSEFTLDFEENVYADTAIFVPAGKWHNLTNTGHKPLKLYSIYAPPEHPYGTIHETKAMAMAAEENHHH